MANLQLRIDALNNASRTINQVDGDLRRLGDRTVGVGQGMTAGLTAPIAAIGGVTTFWANESEKYTASVIEDLNLTEDEAKKVAETGKEVWLDGWGENLAHVQDSLVAVKRANEDLNGDALKDATSDVMLLQEKYQESAGVISMSTTNLSKKFGETEDKVRDMLYTFYQEGGNSSGEGLEVLNEYAQAYERAGYSLEGMMSVFLESQRNGVWSLDKVGDTVKEGFISLSNMTDKQKGMVSELGLSYKDLQSDINAGGKQAQDAFGRVLMGLSAMDNETRNMIGVELFKTQWEDVSETIILGLNEASKQGLDNFNGKLDEVKKKRDEMASDSWAEISRGFIDAIEPIGKEVLVILTDLAEAGLPIVQFLGNTIENMGPAGRKAVVGIGMLISGLGTLLVVGGTVINTVAGLFGGMGNLVRVFGRFMPLARLAGKRLLGLIPVVGWIIVAVWTLIDVFKFLYKNWDAITDGGLKIWNGFLDGLKAIGKGIGSLFTNVVDGVIWTFENGFGLLVGIVKSPINLIIDMINFVINKMNQLSFTVPNWAGKSIPGLEAGQTIGVSIPTIPRLHQGGIFNAPVPGGEGYALLKDGEQVINHRAGGNQTGSVYKGKDGKQYVNIILNIDGNKLVQALGVPLEELMNIELR
ncbi:MULTISPECIES: phage tail tape measure protein [Pontibacillus]|uniref:Phage tail tape measure protein n=1 Tax=Pontibacillus chungwhensis TaxID=265426 RepID=A0ABY8V3T3_9BACI|nr:MULTISPECIES: phage tail tape measure protein [Pontibacillus]MCD5326146.1 phage tail tape measure protein [Pontibacillus sp. HN14]WIG00296.1 phage tail tape measure protein [Pontibacillus chungwhensis]